MSSLSTPCLDSQEDVLTIPSLRTQLDFVVVATMPERMTVVTADHNINIQFDDANCATVQALGSNGAPSTYGSFCQPGAQPVRLYG